MAAAREQRARVRRGSNPQGAPALGGWGVHRARTAPTCAHERCPHVPRAPCTRIARSRAGKKLLDELKKKGEDLTRSNPRSDRLQPYKSQYMRLCKLYVDSMKEHQRAKEQMRKLQLDTVVNRAAIAYGGTKSEAELREVRAAGASRHTPLAGVCWPAAAPRAERITNGPFPHRPPPSPTRARTRP